MRETTLGQLLQQCSGSIKTGPFGTILKAAEYSLTGVPVISVGEVGHGRLRVGPATPRVERCVTDRLQEYVLRAGDVVFGRKGAVDRSAWVQSVEDGYFLGSDGIRVRFGDEVDSRFMSYQFRSATVRQWLTQHAAGSTMLSLNQAILERVPVTVPGLHEQRAIAEVLGALDDKIAANTKLVNQLDELLRLHYESLARDGDSAPLSSLADFVNGKAFTKGASGTGRVVVRIAELNSGIGNSTVYNDLEVDNRHLARPGDILFAWSGSLTVQRWFRPEAIINQHIFKVIPARLSPWVVKGALDRKLAEFRSIAADKATTMGHIQRRHLDELVLVPNRAAVARHDEAMNALWSRALNAEQESLTLGETRDALLPALMSGKIRVKDAERVVEEVV